MNVKNMNTNIEGDDIIVERGGGTKSQGAGANTGGRAGAGAGAGAGGGGGQRGKEGMEEVPPLQGRPKRAVLRSQREASISFEAVTGAGRKRSAEWSVADQLAALRILVEGLVKQHQEKEEHAQDEIRGLKKEMEGLKGTIQAWRQEQLAAEKAKGQDQKAFHTAIQEEHKKQAAAVEKVQTILKEKGQRPSYSDIAKSSGAHTEQPWSVVERRKASPKLQPHKDKDEQAVTIDASRTKAEKVDYAIVKAKLQEGLDNI